MLIETVVAVLALGKLKAIFTPIFSGYGAEAIATRLSDCEATMLITADGFRRRSGVVPLKATADTAVAMAPTVREVLVVRRLGGSSPEQGRDLPWTAGRDHWWHEALSAPGVEPLRETPATDPETPYMVIYTSGTTGRPKGAVHVHGGFPIKAAQDLAHDFDLRPGDRLFWFTDLGWMMGPWAISGALLLGASLVLYEGTPDFPGPDRLWAIAARHGVTHLGLSPTVIRPGARPRAVRAMTYRACGCSVRPASRGTRSPGGGSSARSAEGAARSSTTAAAPRSAAASSAATC
jgi:acetyl-CoA synthetase